MNLLDKPNCSYWRIAASAVIVLGTIESLFLLWSIRSVEQTPLLNTGTQIPQRDLLPEGRNILLAALATSLTISARLRSSIGNIATQNHIVFETLRSLILLSLGIVSILSAGYSLLFYVPSLSDLVTHTIV